MNMTTIKAYTDLEQSKKLAEILPLESADMCYRYYSGGMITGYGDCILAKSFITGRNVIRENDLPCWSLSALLEEIPDAVANIVGENLKLHIDKDGIQYSLFYENAYTGDMFEIETELYDNFVDACYEMIIKLHELKML